MFLFLLQFLYLCVFFFQHFCSADPCTRNKIIHPAVNYSDPPPAPKPLYKTDYNHLHTYPSLQATGRYFHTPEISSPPLRTHAACCSVGYMDSSPRRYATAAWNEPLASIKRPRLRINGGVPPLL